MKKYYLLLMTLIFVTQASYADSMFPASIRSALKHSTDVNYISVTYVSTATGTTDPELQTMILEALGWHANSYQAKNIADAALRISKDSKYAPEVRNEALKTYNRITQ